MPDTAGKPRRTPPGACLHLPHLKSSASPSRPFQDRCANEHIYAMKLRFHREFSQTPSGIIGYIFRRVSEDSRTTNPLLADRKF
jgi:hypothetical protein